MPSPAAPTRVVIVSAQPPEGVPIDTRSDARSDAPQQRLQQQLQQGLQAAGYQAAAVLQLGALLSEQLAQAQPDLVVLHAEIQAQHSLQQLLAALQTATTGLAGSRMPIVLFTNDTDTRQVQQALAAGVVAYEVGGLTAERVGPVLTVAWARFVYQEHVLAQLEDARAQLADRKCIDKAKALLMQRHQIGEPEAYARLRKAAMDKGQKMAEVAQRIVDAADLLM
jgi:two-component system, response regulator / RNA-binding antiterminator